MRWDALGTFQYADNNQWFEPLDEQVHRAEVEPVVESAQPEPWSQPDPWGPTTPWEVSDEWAASKCTACESSTIWRGANIIYPLQRRVVSAHEDMPARARELYDEAANVMTVSRRAGAAMARATLERLLIELDPDAPPHSALDDRLLRIEEQVPSSLAAVLTVIRHGGNKAVHPRDEPDGVLVLLLDKDDEAIVDVIFSAINDLVDELITKPRTRSELLAAVPAGVLDALDKKRARATSKASS